MGYLKFEVYFKIALFPKGVSNCTFKQDEPDENGVIYSELISDYKAFNKYICNENQIKQVLNHLNKLHKTNNDEGCYVESLIFDKSQRECFKCVCLIRQLQNEYGDSGCEDNYGFDDDEELDECLKHMIVPRECEFSDAHITIDGKLYTIQIEIEYYNESYVKNPKKTVKAKKNSKIDTQPITANNDNLLNKNTDKVTTTVITSITTITTVNGVSTSSTVTTTEVK